VVFVLMTTTTTMTTKKMQEALQLKIALHLLRSVVRQVNAQAQRKYHELRKTARSR
jgi:hypothetical protein